MEDKKIIGMFEVPNVSDMTDEEFDTWASSMAETLFNKVKGKIVKKGKDNGQI